MKKESTHSFLSYDGTKLEGTLSVPDTKTNKAVILVHGIMSSRDELGLYSGLAKKLSENNIVSFRFDYRCHGKNKQDKKYMTLAGIVNDIEAACIFMKQKQNPEEIYVVGMSFSGGLTAYWAATTSTKIESVVMLAPVIDYQEDILGQHGFIDDGKLNKKAGKELSSKEYIKADGIKYSRSLINEIPYINGIIGLTRLKCESIILHGDADSMVPYKLSEKYSTLNDNCKLINIPGTDHGFGVPGDEDLTSDETKKQHEEVFNIITNFILSGI